MAGGLFLLQRILESLKGIFLYLFYLFITLYTLLLNTFLDILCLTVKIVHVKWHQGFKCHVGVLGLKLEIIGG